MPPGREVGVDRGLRCPQPQLLEAADLGGGERLVGDVLQRVTVPQRQRVARAVLLDEPFERATSTSSVAQAGARSRGRG